MYTVVVDWGEHGGYGLFIPLRLRQLAPSEMVDPMAIQRVVTPAEIAKARRLGDWLIKNRCDLLDRTPP